MGPRWITRRQVGSGGCRKLLRAVPQTSQGLLAPVLGEESPLGGVWEAKKTPETASQGQIGALRRPLGAPEGAVKFPGGAANLSGAKQ
jgi:hypothetical protein